MEQWKARAEALRGSAGVNREPSHDGEINTGRQGPIVAIITQTHMCLSKNRGRFMDQHLPRLSSLPEPGVLPVLMTQTSVICHLNQTILPFFMSSPSTVQLSNPIHIPHPHAPPIAGFKIRILMPRHKWHTLETPEVACPICWPIRCPTSHSLARKQVALDPQSFCTSSNTTPAVKMEVAIKSGIEGSLPHVPPLHAVKRKGQSNRVFRVPHPMTTFPDSLIPVSHKPSPIPQSARTGKGGTCGTV
jgi:hypothetical protein